MDSDISNSISDGLRNVVMGRVTEDGSWTKIGRFSDVKAVTFHGEPMPEEFKTRHLTLWDEVSFTVDVEPTFAKQIADEIYEAYIKPFLSQMWDQLSNTEEICVCYANPDDSSVIELIKFMYGCMPLLIYNVVYTENAEKGKIYLVPMSKLYGLSQLFGAQATTTIIDEFSMEKPEARDISWIRKRMKHCKNPMERKQLEKELNAAYKKKKRRKKNE